MLPADKPLDPFPEASAIGDGNVERLLGASYAPATPDAEFVRQVEMQMCATAAELAQARGEGVHFPSLGYVDKLLHTKKTGDVQVQPPDQPIDAAMNEERLHRLRWKLSAVMALAAVLAGVALTLHAQRGKRVPLAADTLVKVEKTKLKADFAPIKPDVLTARPRPQPASEQVLKVGEALRTAPGERKRVKLPDGSVVYLNQSTTLGVLGPRSLRLAGGEVFVEVAPRLEGSDDAEFVVKTAERSFIALGTKFAVSRKAGGDRVLVTQGKVKVTGFPDLVLAGQQLGLATGEVTAAPRATHLLAWTRSLIAAAESPLVPASQFGGGALVAVDPNGQEARLSLRQYLIDVHIEDGFARTTIDQTYFNDSYGRMEGTFYFPLPPDASLSRLAMYVDGKLMEGGMAERDHARNVYETIVHQRKDPALLEWIDGSTFKMRVFPLEGRQEKRIILSYTQKLDTLYGDTRYRFPGGHSMPQVRDWAFHALIKGGAPATWSSATHGFKVHKDGGDLLLDAQARNIKPEKDVELTIREESAANVAARFALADHEGARYLMVRYRPDFRPLPRSQALPGNALPRGSASQGAASTRHLRDAQSERQSLSRSAFPGGAWERGRHWIFLFESSGDRDPLLARVQIDVIRTLLNHVEHDDTFALLTAGTHVQAFAEQALPATPENVANAVAFLEKTHLIGALDLGRALAATGPLVTKDRKTCLVHVGSGIAAMGERRPDVLAQRLPDGMAYVGVGIGKRWARGFMKDCAERSGGYFTQINPDEPVSWRAFELLATLNTPRLLKAQVEVTNDPIKFLNYTGSVTQGEELCAIARLPADPQALPSAVTITGLLDGQPYRKTLPVRNVAERADYLPRTWAKLEIDRLLAEDGAQHKAAIVALSKAMYVMTPFTSLLVLENEAMYAQYKVDRGRKDHWAMYPCPDTIPVVYEPENQLAVQNRTDRGGKKPTREAVLKTILVRVPPRLLIFPNEVESFGGKQVVTAKELVDERRSVPWASNSFRLIGMMVPPFVLPDLRQNPVDIVLRSTQILRMKDKAGKPSIIRTVVNERDAVARVQAMATDPTAAQVTGESIGTTQITLTDVSGNEQTFEVKVQFDMPYLRDILRRAVPTAKVEPILLDERTVVLSGSVAKAEDWDILMRTAQGLMQIYAYGAAAQGSNAGGGATGGGGGGGQSNTADQFLYWRQTTPFGSFQGGGFQAFGGGGGFQGGGLGSAGLPSTTTINYNGHAEVVVGSDVTGRNVILRQVPSIPDGKLTIINAYSRDEFKDILAQVQETPTGSLMFGVGTNAIAGVEGLYLPARRLVVRGSSRIHTRLGGGLLGSRLFWELPLLSHNDFLFYQRPTFSNDERIFRDLVAYAPGMNTSTADIQAVLETEAEPSTKLGKIDAEARSLIDKARGLGWQIVTLPKLPQEAHAPRSPEFSVKCDGAGRYVYQRVLASGLREQVVCDGTTLLHLYPELGIGARRTVSRFHRAEFVRLIPWSLPPVEDFAHDADVRFVRADTVDIMPHGADAKDAKGQPVEFVAQRLIFAASGQLAERRVVHLPREKTLWREVYGADGTVQLYDGNDKVLVEQRYEVRQSEMPELQPETAKLVVLPLPYRTGEQDLHSPWLRRFATAFALQDTAELERRYKERMDRQPNESVGYLAFLYACGCSLPAQWQGKELAQLFPLGNSKQPPKNDQKDDSLASLFKRLQRLAHAFQKFSASQVRKANADFAYSEIQELLAEQPPSLRSWCALEWLIQLVERDQSTPAESQYSKKLILDAFLPLFARPVLFFGDDVKLRHLLYAQLYRRFETVPELAYFARYEAARHLELAGYHPQAQTLFAQLYKETLATGVVPPLDDAFYKAFAVDETGTRTWTALLHQAADRLHKDNRPLDVLALAWQCHQLGDEKLADELFSVALRDLDKSKRHQVTLAGVLFLRQSEQWARADALLQPLLQEQKASKEPWLWRLAADLAARRGAAGKSLSCLEKALDLEFSRLPEMINVQAVRTDYGLLLTGYQKLADALNLLEAPAPAELAAKVVRAADRWRALDPEPTAACQAAARILQTLGAAELAWDYLTTPVGLKPNEAEPWRQLAESLRGEGNFALADRAYLLAFEAEPTNAQLLWDRIQLLHQLGKQAEALPILHQLAESLWQPRFEGIKSAARRLLTER